MTKLKDFFIKKQSAAYVTPWYHGYLYYRYESNENITALLPLAPFLRLIRIIYLHFKFGSYDLRRYYEKQESLRDKKQQK